MFIGQKLGPFIIEKELGSGAMGSVYRAVYAENGHVFALKMISPALVANETAVLRFEREAAILKQLRHPNIVRLHSYGRYKGTPFFVMEFVKGESLDHVLMRRGRFTWEDVVHVGRQVCLALQHAHDKGIIHRDIKPSNLMMLDDGTVKLTDFGIAKDMDVTALTGANCTVGTAAYMSPEQCRGEVVVSGKSDLYSLGVVFFELLTGRKPFQADSPVEMFMKHVNEPPPRPSRLVTDIPVWLDTLVLQMLEKKPEHRPLNAEMAVKALDEVIEKAGKGHSAAVDAVTARVVDRRVQTSVPDETDREAARTLRAALGKKKSRKKSAGAVLVRVGAVIAGVLLLFLFSGLGIWLLVRPPNADDLYAAAEKKMQDPATYAEALADQYGRDGPIRKFLAYHDHHPNAEQVRQWEDAAEKHLLLQRLQRMMTATGPLAPRPHSGFERNAVKALGFDEFGDVLKAARYWRDAHDAVAVDDAREKFQKSLALTRVWELNQQWKKEENLLPLEITDPKEKMIHYRLRLLQRKFDEARQLEKEQKFEEANHLLKRMRELYDDESDARIRKLLGGEVPKSGETKDDGAESKKKS